MSVLKVIEILSDSEKSWEDAAAKGIKKASESLKGIKSAYINEQSVVVGDNKITKYRVNMKVTFEVGK